VLFFKCDSIHFCPFSAPFFLFLLFSAAAYQSFLPGLFRLWRSAAPVIRRSAVERVDGAVRLCERTPPERNGHGAATTSAARHLGRGFASRHSRVGGCKPERYHNAMPFAAALLSSLICLSACSSFFGGASPLLSCIVFLGVSSYFFLVLCLAAPLLPPELRWRRRLQVLYENS